MTSLYRISALSKETGKRVPISGRLTHDEVKKWRPNLDERRKYKAFKAHELIGKLNDF